MAPTAHPQFESGQRLIAEYPEADWDGLCARYSRSLYRRVLGIVRNPQDMETAVSLRYMQGLCTREAARTCGVSENTLKARLRRARLRLARSKSLFALL